MYRCPRLVDVPVVVELPSVMYRTPPHVLAPSTTPLPQHSCPAAAAAAAAAHLTQQSSSNKGSPAAASALEARQEAVLKRLQTLKAQLDLMQSTQTVTNANTTTTAATAAAAAAVGGLGAAACSSPVKTSSCDPIQDLVISASPAAPPLSLLVLRRLLAQSGLPVHCSSRVHSSIAQVRPELQEAFTESPLEERRKHSLGFSLQWTDVPSPSLMIHPLRQTRIGGEANIVRYLSRLLPATSPYNYEATGTFTAIAEADHLLDTLERTLLLGAGKERAALMRELANRLSRSAFLCGSQCGAADLLGWSLLRQRGGGGGVQDEAVGRWLARVDALTGIDLSKITTTTTTTTTTTKKKAASPQTTTTTTTTTTKEEKKVCHKGRKDLERYLKELGIAFQVKEHREVFTVEELMGEVEGLPGIITKNLFLRDKKKTLYILSTKHDTEIDLKVLAKQINTKDLRFADATVLYDTLGVRQGCVSPLALINDPGQVVRVVLETAIVDLPCGHVYFHPLSNAASLGLKPAALERFLEAVAHPPLVVQF